MKGFEASGSEFCVGDTKEPRAGFSAEKESLPALPTFCECASADARISIPFSLPFRKKEMTRNIANCISVSRIIMSIILCLTEAFSIAFCIIYFYCGISDMIDGFIARKSKNESNIGAKLDSAADIIFISAAMIKILPILNLTDGIIIWAVFIAFIKIVNIACSYIYHKKIVLPHTIANKITGFILFISPFIFVNTNPIILEIIICTIATYTAVQEGHYIRTRNF